MKDGAEKLGDFRPIALLNSFLEIISKVIANRLGPIRKDLIGDHQTGFVAGRNIFDGVVAAQEAIHQSKKTNTKGYLLKLDFEKAYDMVNWECLLEVLE